MFEKNEQHALSPFVEQAYLDYSLYVILDRALPFVGDGLKPVQRRIIYAMSELGLSAQSKPKKSARTVGDVIGKYHPHGDSACYEAMVLMAQPFSYRQPLIDGQGNWGSADDPKSFAAMRYTESRLTPYAKALLQELSEDTVDWKPNFDGSLQEPKSLPARLPNVLINGAMGIAVGLSTTILPHNIEELVQACLALLENPELEDKALLDLVPAPDFPTGGEIVSSPEDLAQLYLTGRGTVRVRAKYHLEKQQIVITELPYQVSGSKIQEQLAKLMQAKKLPYLDDIRDESDHQHPTRLVLIPKGRIEHERVMEHLFASSDLEKRYNSQMNVIGLDGKPSTQNLRRLLTEWLQYREQTLTRRLHSRLHRVLQRLHLLRALMVAHLNLDEVVRIIREEDLPQSALMASFNLDLEQAEMILNTRLKQLAKLEKITLEREQSALQQERDLLQHQLNNPNALRSLLAEELRHDGEQYHSPRRSQIRPQALPQALDEQSLAPSESIALIVSQMGWIRGAKGHQVEGESLSYKNGDGFLLQLNGKSNQSACLLMSNGRVYTLPLHQLPSARGQGEPLSSRFQMEAEASLVQAVLLDEKAWYVVAGTHGYGFKVHGSDLVSKTKNGKALLTTGEGKALCLQALHEAKELLLISNDGHALIMPTHELPELNKGKGMMLISIPAKAFTQGKQLSTLALLNEHTHISLQHGKQTLPIPPHDREAYRQARGNKGKALSLKSPIRVSLSEPKPIPAHDELLSSPQ
ncbi:MAG: DNA topoisomerase IV subunit A [Cardiobacteriaceae bacterium]|nr:DNA topoisomerase IV subunit A [Cardiobacteriaceae bacterium]